MSDDKQVILESLRECRNGCAAAMRVVYDHGLGDECLAAMKERDVQDGFGKRADAILDRYFESAKVGT